MLTVAGEAEKWKEPATEEGLQQLLKTLSGHGVWKTVSYPLPPLPNTVGTSPCEHWARMLLKGPSSQKRQHSKDVDSLRHLFIYALRMQRWMRHNDCRSPLQETVLPWIVYVEDHIVYRWLPNSLMSTMTGCEGGFFVSMGMEAREWCQMSTSIAPPPYFWEWVFHGAQSSQI